MAAITRHGALTLADLQAKAAVMIAAFEFNLPFGISGTVEEDAECHELLAWRMAHEILEALA